ncbi:hypothetical protein UCRNP2_3950 [Neofusicoccum parvum UCRNP2]|uniref:Extracellular membrane protein CFEM domain-containing protein n=1 Tax=Botryosphaeria parva (strain UCR-NP2) TaxID=1287680 RepID=R1EN99_BOTPV|nr:hypothetical protein UCRNP2_3950 [Neofusicoccum parvum UCRNP2]
MKFALSLAIAALNLLAAAQDLSILTNSCAANDFIAASTAAGNPCGATDYKCQCTTGKQFTQDFVTKAVTSSGECSLNELTRASITALAGSNPRRGSARP